MRIRGVVVAVVAACGAVAIGLAGVGPADAVEPRSPDGPVVLALTVPWAIGGPRIEADGTLDTYPGDWPSIPFQSIRLWDSRTAWLNIEPRKGRWAFDRLDQFVVKARTRGVRDISLVLGGTPRWAARQQRPADSPSLGAGSASPPRDWADWADFVTAVVTRYRGLITSYELWNEPNNPAFWSGTRSEWVRLVRIAAQRIRAVDPAAVVVTSGFRMRQASDVARVTPWLAALGAARVRVDAVSMHWYPDKGADLGDLARVVPALATQAQWVGLGTRVWITEVNVRGGATLTDAAQQLAVERLSSAARSGGAERMSWYAWTDLGPPDLMPLFPGTPAARALGLQATQPAPA